MTETDVTTLKVLMKQKMFQIKKCLLEHKEVVRPPVVTPIKHFMLVNYNPRVVM